MIWTGNGDGLVRGCSGRCSGRCSGKCVGRVGAINIHLVDSSHVGVSMPRSEMALLSNFPENTRGIRTSIAGLFVRHIPKGRTIRYADGWDGISLGSSAQAFPSRTISDNNFIAHAMARVCVYVQRARHSAALIQQFEIAQFLFPRNLQIMNERLVAGPARSAGRSLIGS